MKRLFDSEDFIKGHQSSVFNELFFAPKKIAFLSQKSSRGWKGLTSAHWSLKRGSKELTGPH